MRACLAGCFRDLVWGVGPWRGLWRACRRVRSLCAPPFLAVPTGSACPRPSPCCVQVHLQGVVSTVVITTMVLEGWSTKLDPDIRILDTLRDILPTAWHERAGRGVDRVMSSGALALAS